MSCQVYPPDVLTPPLVLLKWFRISSCNHQPSLRGIAMSYLNDVLRQTRALTKKNALVFKNHWIINIVRCLLIPIGFFYFLTLTSEFFANRSEQGIGNPQAIEPLHKAINRYSGKFLLIDTSNNPSLANEIGDIITYNFPSKIEVLRRQDASTLHSDCLGKNENESNCVAAVKFRKLNRNHNIYSYTILGSGTETKLTHIFRNSGVNDHNGPISFSLSLQHAVESAIAEAVTGKKLSAPEEYSYSEELDKIRIDGNKRSYMSTLQTLLIVAFFLGILGPVYHLVCSVSQEREAGLTYLMDVMGCRRSARFASWWLYISLAYLPAFIAMGLLLAKKVFTYTPTVILVGLLVLTLFVLVSYSLFLSSFFTKGMTSGILAVIMVACVGFLAKYLESKLAPPGYGWAIMILFVPPSAYIYGLLSIATFEERGLGAVMNELPYGDFISQPLRPLTLTVLFSLMVLLIFIYPLLGILVEYKLHSTSPLFRRSKSPDTSAPAVSIENLTKTYSSSIFFNRKKVTAVDNISLSVPLGSIVCLIGSNGSGKSTTLNCLTGLTTAQRGTMKIFGRNRWELPPGTLSLCPQKNILWDELTPREHADIWRRIKSPNNEDLSALLNECDLTLKQNSQSKYLSGGMKRRLQLLISLVGGSRVCCLDEVSSGLDPLSRRKIWNILLANRGKRTFIQTTHYLEEADLLSDWIAIMSNGVIKCFGEPLELRNTLGNGYTVCAKDEQYFAKDPIAVTKILDGLDTEEIVSIQGPTLEEVFLKLAKEEMAAINIEDHETEEKINLSSGRQIGSFFQALAQAKKRFLIARRGYFLVPILTVLIVGVVIWVSSQWVVQASCSEIHKNVELGHDLHFNPLEIDQYGPLCFGPDENMPSSSILNLRLNLRNLTVVSTTENMREEFLQMQNRNAEKDHVQYRMSGGIFFSPERDIVAWPLQGNVIQGCGLLNLVNNIRFNQLVGSDGLQLESGYGVLPYRDVTLKNADSGLLWVQFLGLLMLTSALWVSFPVMYPTYEKILHVRSLQYSNQMRPLAVWTGHLLYEMPLMIILSILIGVVLNGQIQATVNASFFGLGIFSFVLVFFSIAATLLGYVLSLKSKSQFSAFALSATMLLFFFVIFIGGNVGIFVYSNPLMLKRNLNLLFYTLGWLHPVIPLIRAFLVGVNGLEARCLGDEKLLAGDWRLYGSCFFYLVVQSAAYLIFLVCNDASSFLFSRRRQQNQDYEKSILSKNSDVTAEEIRLLDGSDDALQVIQLSKSFGKLKAVDNVTFSVRKGECMVICGPNSAGKTTIFHHIRGVLKADQGDIFVQGDSITKNRGQARRHLGVCPQFDAQDNLTVRQQLGFYADIKGIPKSQRHQDIETVIRVIGLAQFSEKSCAKLSGGNARKLSLAIALLGNPSILLLDEPSCGLDPLAKRIIWDVFPSLSAGRAVLLTTHDMTEAVKLSTRVSILAKRVLAIGTIDTLRSRFGQSIQVEVTTSSTGPTRSLFASRYPGSIVIDESLNRNIKLQITQTGNSSHIVKLIKMLEEWKAALNIKYYSMKPIGLEDIFLNVLQDWKVAEEEEEEAEQRWYQLWR
ncbi:ATP-binding cassette sub-family A member 1 [Neolecta irregularis DAH-3]|uniref:ATP-binding cassette sub-family A member 1 n=1 Tax=Neolecta irregularis (strain DAH-3) TaxID=1198029 RepID=A0A1U7LQP3_NEOID|nr:ATP-binding cassette sub-family A member 1 [Neolecta irregularis DAH-3]|eukprot:OLL24977.1 ATP-binding cassette sub-family A member 1 [Neolecta irregularis DAH-3]